MIHLLDVNVLLALGDSDHSHADPALRFFERTAVREGWATCPITENAFLRILGSPNYPSGPGTAGEARRILQSLVAAPGHQFWPDEISLLDTRALPTLPTSGQLTDLYLLGLAAKRGGRLATFDRKIDSSLIEGGAASLHILPDR